MGVILHVHRKLAFLLLTVIVTVSSVYVYHQTPVNYRDARLACEDGNGQLVVLDSQDKTDDFQVFMTGMKGTYPNLNQIWLAWSYDMSWRRFIWRDYSDVTWTNWKVLAAQPSGHLVSRAPSLCGAVYRDEGFRLSTTFCYRGYTFACESGFVYVSRMVESVFGDGVGERYHPVAVQERDRYGGGSIMVWATITYDNRTDLTIVQATSVYTYIDSVVTYRDAIIQCRDPGEMLLTLDSKTKVEDFTAYVDQLSPAISSTVGMWISLSYDLSWDSLLWLDDVVTQISTFDYWESGEPDYLPPDDIDRPFQCGRASDADNYH